MLSSSSSEEQNSLPIATMVIARTLPTIPAGEWGVEEVTAGPGGGGMEVEVTAAPGGGGMEVEVTAGPGGGGM